MPAEDNTAKPKLKIIPCSRAQAKNFIDRLHRHHRPPLGGFFQIAVVDETGLVRGVAMVGRPVARLACDGLSAEVNRIATDGCPNACSALYGACWRIAKGMGYRRIITYTLPQEGGASLRGAGWRRDGEVVGREWNARLNPEWTKRGSRKNDWPTTDKVRWVKEDPSAFNGEVDWPRNELPEGGTVDLFGEE
jgi:hypothetical protein